MTSDNGAKPPRDQAAPARPANVLVDPYRDWSEGEGIPIHLDFGHNLLDLETGPWDRYDARQPFAPWARGVGFGVRHNMETFADIGARINRVVAVGGGTQTATWLQIVSDITGITQILPKDTLGASYGNAYLAGLAAGVLPPQNTHPWVQVDRLVKPDASKRPLYDAMYTQYLNLYQGSKAVMHQLKSITERYPS